jgi:hypothetical protein
MPGSKRRGLGSFDVFASRRSGYKSRPTIGQEVGDLVTEQHRQEQQTEQAIKVRQVTDVHANWSAQERGEHGKFSYQLILDDGAAEYVLRVTADDAKVLRDWFHDADTVYFDMEREVLIFGEMT